MCRNLLLGNGLNMNLNINDMTLEDIAQRNHEAFRN